MRGLAVVWFVVATTACTPGPEPAVVPSCVSSVVELTVPQNVPLSMDLLFVVDDSAATFDQSPRFAMQVAAIVSQLTDPPCTSLARPSPHACDPRDAGDQRGYDAVRDLHVGVVSSDLGSGPRALAGCSVGGDDARLDPLARGAAVMSSGPVALAGCNAHDANDPGFLQFESHTTVAASVASDSLCEAALGGGGCVLQQPLEAAWRALAVHDARAVPGNTDPNAGFLRERGVLAIVVVASGDDASVRDCRDAQPGDGCVDATDVFDPASTRWASRDVALRPYVAAACGAQDPTWSLDRYIDPSDPSRGFPGLEPGHPESVVFVAIAGVPLDGDGLPMDTRGGTDWDALLGDPGAGGADDFCARNAGATSGVVDTLSAGGAISMRAANVDPACPSRVVPACRRGGTTRDPSRPACTLAEQYSAPPARRLAEVARRFDQATLCGGSGCGNGAVLSICGDDMTRAMTLLASRTQPRFFDSECLPRVLQQRRDTRGLNTVDCVMEEFTAAGGTCDAARGRTPPTNAPMARTLSDGHDYTACDVAQVATDPASGALVAGTGWYYSTVVDLNSRDACAQRIAFTDDATPSHGAIDRLECVQSLNCAP